MQTSRSRSPGTERGSTPALRHAARYAGLTPSMVASTSAASRHCSAGSGIQRVPVEHHDRCAGEQRRDEGVPHHPGRRREPHQPVAGAEIPAQCVVLEMLDEDARRGHG